MAERKITMPIALKKNDNQYNPGYGMYYPEIVSTEALSLRGLCERVAFSQSVYSRDIVEGVVTKLRDALVELLQGGQPVKEERGDRSLFRRNNIIGSAHR